MADPTPTITYYDRGGSTQAVVSFRGKRTRRQFPTRLEAEAWGTDTARKLMAGMKAEKGPQAKVTGDDPPTKLSDLAERCYRHHWKRTADGAKQRDHALQCAAILGDIHPARVTRSSYDILQEKLEDLGNGPATINRKCAAFRKILSFAVEREWLTSRPTFKALKEAKLRTFRISKELERKMLSWALRHAPRDYHDWLVMALDSGVRKGEALAIEYRDINLETRTMTLPGEITKNGEPRSIPLTKALRLVLTERQLRAHNQNNEKVFEGVTSDGIDHYWDRMRTALGLADERSFTPHRCRHEFCSRMAERGASASEIQSVSGHLTQAVCQRYVDLYGVSQSANVRRLVAGE